MPDAGTVAGDTPSLSRMHPSGDHIHRPGVQGLTRSPRRGLPWGRDLRSSGPARLRRRLRFGIYRHPHGDDERGEGAHAGVAGRRDHRGRRRRPRGPGSARALHGAGRRAVARCRAGRPHPARPDRDRVGEPVATTRDPGPHPRRSVRGAGRRGSGRAGAEDRAVRLPGAAGALPDGRGRPARPPDARGRAGHPHAGRGRRAHLRAARPGVRRRRVGLVEGRGRPLGRRAELAGGALGQPCALGVPAGGARRHRHRARRARERPGRGPARPAAAHRRCRDRHDPAGGGAAARAVAGGAVARGGVRQLPRPHADAHGRRTRAPPPSRGDPRRLRSGRPSRRPSPGRWSAGRARSVRPNSGTGRSAGGAGAGRVPAGGPPPRTAGTAEPRHAEWAPWERGVNRTPVPPLPTPPATGGSARGADVAVPAARTAAAGGTRPDGASPPPPAPTATPAGDPPRPRAGRPSRSSDSPTPPRRPASATPTAPDAAGTASTPDAPARAGRARGTRVHGTRDRGTRPCRAGGVGAGATRPPPPTLRPWRPPPQTADAPAEPEAQRSPRPRTPAATKRTRKGKPVMPSWDEVLLGVRGPR